ncbi:SseB family protein [Clostridium sp. BJN0001]|uniref:SseB family protein n=1 Tax=Clostridium sp. BJN0001 TaxID=2930219 RepID=UPI001FD47BE4|nr:SseB family protein [Clostridium sp. BJN0001]
MSVNELIEEYYKNNNDKVIYKKIVESLKNEDEIYIAYCPYIRNYYVDFNDKKASAYIFSSEEIYKKFEECMAKNMFILKIIKNRKDERISLFQDFYRNGIEQIVVKAEKDLKMSLFDMIDKPDFSDIPYVNRPILNPFLLFNINYFFECLSAKKADKKIEINMFKEIKKGKYLIPMDATGVNLEKSDSKNTEATIKKDSVIHFPIIKNRDGKSFYPIFTDWAEFIKFDSKKKYVGNIISFEDISHLIKNVEGVAINPFGVNLILNDSMINTIKNI